MTFRTFTLVAAAASLSAACAAPAADAGAQSAQVQAQDQVRSDHHDHAHASNKTEGRYIKPGPAVVMEGDMLTLAKAGDVGTVDVQIAGAPGDLRATLGSSTGLEILGRTDRDVAAGDLLRVDVRAPSEGRHYLDVIVTDAQGQPRAMSVAVQVGSKTSVAGSKPVDMMMSGNGEPRHVVPARETINGVAVETDGMPADGER